MKYILAADDEEMNLDILEEILSDDYEVNFVENGRECLKSIEKRIPDLLLLDVAMPEMDGIEVCHELRKSEATKDLIIIVLSGFASESSINEAMNAGANKYITKPFLPNELLDIVSEYL